MAYFLIISPTIPREKIWSPFPSEFLVAARVRFGKIANNTTELDSYADNENFLNEDTYLLIIATISYGRAHLNFRYFAVIAYTINVLLQREFFNVMSLVLTFYRITLHFSYFHFHIVLLYLAETAI